MDLQKEQDSNAHCSVWVLVICKHWNWNWYWDWKYCIFLTKGGDIVWVTASTKLCDLLITWSRDKCKALHLPPLKSHDLLITWSRGKWKNIYICTSAIPIAIKLGRVVTYGRKTPRTKSCYLLITWSCDKCKTLCLHFHNIYGHQTWQSGNLPLEDLTHQVMWPFDYVVMWQMEKNLSALIWCQSLPKLV